MGVQQEFRRRKLTIFSYLLILTLVFAGGTTGVELEKDAVILEAAPIEARSKQDGDTAGRDKRQLLGGGSFGGGLFPPGWPFLPAGSNPVSVSQQFPQFPQFSQFPGISNIQHIQQLQPTQAPPTTTTQTPPGACQTSNGRNGYCASFRACYPRLYNLEDESITNNALADMYMNMSGPCNNRPDASGLFMFRRDATLRQNQICCGTSVQSQPQLQFPNFPFGPNFGFPQLTMRPPWALQPARISTTTPAPTTTSTTTTTTTPRPTTTTTKRYQQPTQWWQTTSTTQRYQPQPTQWWQTTTTTQRYQQQPTQWWQTTSKPATVHPPTPSTTTSPPVSSSCGVGKIVGGSQSRQGEFPWLVALIRNGRQVCGGSLIDSQYILTAAHCFNGVTSHELQTLFKVYIGDYDLHTLSDGPMTVKSISKLILHREFHQTYFYNDIALIKLDSPVQLGSNGNNDIRPICLSSSGSGSYEASQVWVAGWGRTSVQSPYQPGIYRKVELKVWNINQCAATYGQQAPGGITHNMLCAGSTNKDSCLGDSGGPLMRQVGGRWEQIGLVSWGIGCGAYPGVYTKIADYQDWISRHRAS